LVEHRVVVRLKRHQLRLQRRLTDAAAAAAASVERCCLLTVCSSSRAASTAASAASAASAAASAAAASAASPRLAQPLDPEGRHSLHVRLALRRRLLQRLLEPRLLIINH